MQLAVLVHTCSGLTVAFDFDVIFLCEICWAKATARWLAESDLGDPVTHDMHLSDNKLVQMARSQASR